MSRTAFDDTVDPDQATFQRRQGPGVGVPRQSMDLTHVSSWVERAVRFREPLVREAQLAGEVRADLDPECTARWVGMAEHHEALDVDSS
jgi:hypothetical protein